MSATTTTATTTAVTATTLVGMLPPTMECPTCGQDPSQSQSNTAEDSRRRIRELEGQVQNLNVQAKDTTRKLAEYEEEVRRLRSQADPYIPLNRPSTSSSDLQPQQPQQQSRLTALASFLPYHRRPSTSPSSPPFSSPLPDIAVPDTVELQNALDREQNLRKAAESKLSLASSELEELTAQLFSQANEMVAQERRARAKLEERVALLERRDIEKRARLERLEKAMERVGRLRKLVG